MNERVDQLRETMREMDLDAFLVTDRTNRRYLSGFSGSSGALLITRDEGYLITDFRYFEQAGQQAPEWTLWKQLREPDSAIVDLLSEQTPTRLGFEADVLPVASYNRLRSGAPGEIEWVPTTDVIVLQRGVKDDAELESIRNAQSITDTVAGMLPEVIRPGKSEAEVAWAIEVRLREQGATGLAFPIIVASGPNAALPHHHPGDRLIQEDEIVLVDMGAELRGYHSDLTRTFFTGEPSDRFRELFNIVWQALEAAEQGLRAGVGLAAGDALARDVIGQAGYGDHFGHGLGHGVGLAIHEHPRLSYRASDEEVLEAGQVVTIEPGIYIPGWGGIRIENLALVRDTDVEIITQTPIDVDAWRSGQ